MKSLIAPGFTDPMGYKIQEKADLTLLKPNDILIEIHAASINGHDVIMASGKTKMLQTVPLPYPIGLDFAGTIVDIGQNRPSYGKGDNVYGFIFGGGTASTQLLVDTTKPHAISKIPSGLNMVQAASLPAVAITADVALKHADEFFKFNGGLAGKTVFIPGALAGVGSVALQIAKRKWKCHTISAASSAKIQQIDMYLEEGIVDEVFDYTKADVTKTIGRRVDFVFDTTGLAADYLPMIKRGGLCLSIARIPPGSALKDASPDAPQQSRMACMGQGVMDGMDKAFTLWAKTMYGVSYVYQKTEPRDEDIKAVSDMVEHGDLKAVVGKTAKLDDIDAVRAGCIDIYKGKGGVGKFVVTMKED